MSRHLKNVFYCFSFSGTGSRGSVCTTSSGTNSGFSGSGLCSENGSTTPDEIEAIVSFNKA